MIYLRDKIKKMEGKETPYIGELKNTG